MSISLKDSFKNVGGKNMKISFNKYIKKVGNSLAITIPYHIVQELQLQEDKKVKCTLEVLDDEKKKK